MDHFPSFLHLEVLRRIPAHESRQTPLLFVHGAYVGAWCWEDHFLPYFAAQGYACYALSLSGHAGSNGHDRLSWLSLRDYVADLQQVIDTLPHPPVLIGHSMGGLVIQKYLERSKVPGVVLMASVPPTGILEMNWWVAMTRPQLFQDLWLVQSGAVKMANYGEVRRALFSARLPDSRVARYLERTQAESQRAMIDMSGWDLPVLPWPRPPALVLGATHDALVPLYSVQTTAIAFGVQAELFPDMAHVMMLEPDWLRVAERIRDWLHDQGH